VDQAQSPGGHVEELSAGRRAVPSPHPIIAREGWPLLGGALALAGALTALAGWGWAAPFWLAAAFVLQFFRDPARTAPQDPHAVLSPADGRIVAVERAHDPWLARRALKISVFMNVFNVHSNRSPVDGTVRARWYHPGSFFNAALDKASSANERNALWLRTPEGADVTCVQIAGLLARRILCYADAGAVLARGERYGFIRFGSRVDVYLPEGAEPVVALGDKVRASESILARLPARA
jgi:phosphatidylserine decarboxylase